MNAGGQPAQPTDVNEQQVAAEDEQPFLSQLDIQDILATDGVSIEENTSLQECVASSNRSWESRNLWLAIPDVVFTLAVLTNRCLVLYY